MDKYARGYDTPLPSSPRIAYDFLFVKCVFFHTPSALPPSPSPLSSTGLTSTGFLTSTGLTSTGLPLTSPHLSPLLTSPPSHRHRLPHLSHRHRLPLTSAHLSSLSSTQHSIDTASLPALPALPLASPSAPCSLTSTAPLPAPSAPSLCSHVCSHVDTASLPALPALPLASPSAPCSLPLLSHAVKGPLERSLVVLPLATPLLPSESLSDRLLGAFMGVLCLVQKAVVFMLAPRLLFVFNHLGPWVYTSPSCVTYLSVCTVSQCLFISYPPIILGPSTHAYRQV